MSACVCFSKLQCFIAPVCGVCGVVSGGDQYSLRGILLFLQKIQEGERVGETNKTKQTKNQQN